MKTVVQLSADQAVFPSFVHVHGIIALGLKASAQPKREMAQKAGDHMRHAYCHGVIPYRLKSS